MDYGYPGRVTPTSSGGKRKKPRHHDKLERNGNKQKDRNGRQSNSSTPTESRLKTSPVDAYGLSEFTYSTPVNAVTHAWPEDENDSDDTPEEWSSVCFHFTQNTTFHGVNKITESTPFSLRRVIWVMIVLGGMALFINQMFDSVIHFLDRPVTVNIKINYNKTIKFPAITICNQNVFRTTQAAKLGHYSLIDTMFSKDHHNEVNLAAYNAQNVTMLELYNTSGHSREDLIVSCLWDQRDCSYKDFVTTVTDHGLCYTFNSGKNGTVLDVTQTGSDKGLSLRLNVEQYEYMHGPNSAAGVKILVHDQDEIPLVRELGQAISPGSHAFVGIQMLQINNLEPPYGECSNDMQLKYAGFYTIPGCLVDCREDYLVQKCQCREAFMPLLRNGQGPPVCSLQKYQKCLPPVYEQFYENDEKLCTCPVPCTRKMFETSISYGQISKFDTRRHQRDASIYSIQKKFVNALETVQRVDGTIVERDSELVNNLRESAGQIVTVFSQIQSIMTNVSDILADLQQEMGFQIKFHNFFGLRVVERAVVFGFVQAWDKEQQRTFEPLTVGSNEFLKAYRKTLTRLIETPASDTCFRNILSWELEEMLLLRRARTENAMKALDKIHHSFNTGKQLIDYQWSISKKYDQAFVPKGLLQHRSAYQEYLYQQMNLTTIKLLEAQDILKRHVRTANRTNTFNHTLYHETKKAYENHSDEYTSMYNLFAQSIVYRTKDLVNDRRVTFSRLNETLFKELGDTRITIHQSLDLVTSTRSGIWNDIDKIIKLAVAYVEEKKGNKTMLAKMILSDKIDLQLQRMRDFFNDVRARSRNFDHDWKKFAGAYVAIWKSIKEEDTTALFYKELYNAFQHAFDHPNANSTINFYKMFEEKGVFKLLDTTELEQLYTRTNAALHPVNATLYVNELEERFSNILQNSNIAEVVNERDDKFFEDTQHLSSSLESFLKECQTDENFFRENFLEIDVFMKELYYEQVEQRVAYDSTNLWSDIGGSMGLFVGASIITLFELCDALLHNFLKMRCRNQHNKKKRHAAAAVKHKENGVI